MQSMAGTDIVPNSTAPAIGWKELRSTMKKKFAKHFRDNLKFLKKSEVKKLCNGMANDYIKELKKQAQQKKPTKYANFTSSSPMTEDFDPEIASVESDDSWERILPELESEDSYYVGSDVDSDDENEIDEGYAAAMLFKEVVSHPVEVDVSKIPYVNDSDPEILNMQFGAVARAVDPKTSEYGHPLVSKAIEKEVYNHESNGTFDFENIMEYEDARVKDPTAGFVNLKMLVVEKMAELGLPIDERTYKARLVALGNFLRHASGAQLFDDCDHDVPLNFAETRVLISASLKEGYPALYQGDVSGAYVKSPLQGRTIYAHMSEEMLPEKYRGRFRRPVVPLRTALYGLVRADRDWGDFRHGCMITAKWTEVVPRKIYKKDFDGHTIFAGIYVDDILIGGDTTSGAKAYRELHKLLGFGDAEPQRLSHFIGVDYSDIRFRVKDGRNVRQVFVNQEGLARAIVKRYKESTGFQKLRYVATPGFSSANMVDKTEDDLPGNLKNEASSHVSGVQYLARGSRPDVQETASSLARHYNSWSRLDDRKLHRLMSYIEGTITHGLLLEVDFDDDWSNMHIKNYVDSDHGGDLRTARSTSGCHAELRDHGCTKVLIEHWSKAQDAVAASTGEAEVVAMSAGVRRTGLPLQQLIEDVFGFPVVLETLVDNSAALQIGRTGNTKQLKYLSKHQRVRHGFVHDTLGVPHKDRRLEKVDTRDNLSDLQTKPLDRLRHEELVKMINVMSMEDFLAMVCLLVSDATSGGDDF